MRRRTEFFFRQMLGNKRTKERRGYAKGLPNGKGQVMRETCSVGLRGNESTPDNSGEVSQQNEHPATIIKQKTKGSKF